MGDTGIAVRTAISARVSGVWEAKVGTYDMIRAFGQLH